MQPFEYIRATDRQDAVKAATTANGAKYIGGGTNLVDLMKLGIETPKQIVDINSLDLTKINTLPDGSIMIGALVRNSDLAYNDVIRTKYPVLSQALLSGASPQLRNMATVGGNLMQRTRCPYFYDIAFACNKRHPGSGCDAMHGYNRSHAILGTSENCIATHPSDMCVAMAALGAEIRVQGPNGERTISFSDFHLLPGNTPQNETTLQPSELITAVVIPDLPFATNSCYVKVRDRSSYEFALSSAAVALEINSGKIKNARIALGGVGTKPWRSLKAEKMLTGKTADTRNYEIAAAVVMENAITHNHNAFKVELAKRTLISALEKAGGRS